MPVKFTQIGSTDDCFFWCLREYNGKLYAGTYGYPKAYNYPPWTHLKNFAAGESLTDLKILDGKLYASTENKGYIYRMNPANPTDWTVVHDDAYPWGLALGVMGSYIYCAYAPSPWTGLAKVIRSSNGDSWSEVYKSYKGGWFFILYNGYLYNLGAKVNASVISSALRSSNGTTWNIDSNLAGLSGAFNPALVFNGYLYMALGERPDGKTKIYKYDGSSAPSEVLSVTAFRGYGFNNVAVFDNEMYFLFGPDMNSSSPGSVTYYLYKSATGASGEWTLVKTFTANRKSSHGKWRTQGCVATFAGALYVGIQDKVYRMEPVYTKKTVTCSQCGSSLELTISSKEEENLPMICPICGEEVGTGYTVALITELPWPIYTEKSIICPQCSSELELTISSKPEENIAQVCPVCGAPAD